MMQRSRVLLAPSRPRRFSTTPPSRSVLFNLGGLAASRESQYLSRETGIPRTEYSANIHLIRASEVDPFAPAPGATKQANDNYYHRTAAAAATTALPKIPRRFLTVDGLAEEHRQTQDALQHLRVALHDAREAAQAEAQWGKTVSAVLFALLLVSLYRTWALGEELRNMILEREALAAGAEAAAAHAGRELPETLLESSSLLSSSSPVVVAVPAASIPQPESEKQQRQQQQPAGGVLHWVKSFFWAS